MKTTTVEILKPQAELSAELKPIEINCFKAYDLRGRVPEELNGDVAYRIGRALAQFLRARNVVVGRDIRLSSPAIAKALIAGIIDQGADVLDIGICGSEEVYFATNHFAADGGVIVTASHNPANYNGMKFVRRGSQPISGDDGLVEIRKSAERGEFDKAELPGQVIASRHLESYVDHLLSYIDIDSLKPLKLVVNAGNGAAGRVLDALEPHLPFDFVKIHHEADGSFPHGVPNPLLPENRAVTADTVRASGADIGIAWDGDFDRCFFFDESGEFIEGYYIVGLLAQTLLAKNTGQKIIHDPRLIWNTEELVTDAGGIPIQSKTGHAFIKARMRAEDAVYGGEMSAHHYFRDFAYCDSGMIPWLLIAQLLSTDSKPLSVRVKDRMRRFPVSGEINRVVDDPAGLLQKIEQLYQKHALHTDYTDGLSMEFEQWRFNLRASNTEPVVRLNVESRGDESLMQAKRDELLSLVGASA